MLVCRVDRSLCTYADGATDTFDEQGRWIEHSDANGNRVVLSYNARGRLENIAGPRRSNLRFTSDDADRLARIDGSDGSRVQYVYGQEPTPAGPDGPSYIIGYTYDDDGRLARVTDPRRGATELRRQRGAGHEPH